MGLFSTTQVLSAASIICFLGVVLLFAVFLPFYISPLDTLKFKQSNISRDFQNRRVDQKDTKMEEPLQLILRRLVRGEDRIQLDNSGFACHSDLHSDVCLSSKPVVVDNNGLTLYVPSTEAQSNRTVQPYARKEDAAAMQAVTPVQISRGNTTNLPACDFNHTVPAVVFSSGGFTGNIFHEFNEVVIPLFITCRHFRSRLKFVITDFKPWWVAKYNRILSHLSGYDVINPAENGSVHCFAGAVVGLKYHDNLALNSTDIPGGYTMFDFRNFLRQAYSLKATNFTTTGKPMLILISRSKSRMLTNEDEMEKMMEELGFEVIVVTPFRMENLDKFSSLVNSCSVMVGAHGAGLTNAVFLPEGAVVVQVVPLGLDWAANAYYGRSATEMGLNYLDYKVDPDESSLWAAYGPNHPVITDPASIFLKGYEAARAVYVDEQNLEINLVRFRETMIRAMELLGH